MVAVVTVMKNSSYLAIAINISYKLNSYIYVQLYVAMIIHCLLYKAATLTI